MRSGSNGNRPTYAEKGISTDIEDHSDILIEPVSYPAKEGDQVRLIVLRRDRYTCQRCRATRTNLRVHHIVSKKNGGSDDPDNLITLCHQCHCKMHKSCNDDSAVPTVNADGKPCAGKLARTVWEAA